MILVTGGTGIVGTRLIFDLIREGHRVRATKRPTSDIDFSRKVFRFYSEKDGDAFFDRIEWVDIDFEDIYNIREHLEGVSKVFHTAALVSYLKSDKDKLMATNFRATQNLVNICLETGVEKFCHLSSVAALGTKGKSLPADENTTWKKSKSNSNYGFSKYLAEREVWRATAEGMPAVVVNPGIILGPSKPHQSSGAMMALLRKGISFYPTGKTGLVDVADVSKACLKLMESSVENRRFILNAENLTYRELLDTAAEVFGNKKPSIKASRWMLEVYRWIESVKSAATGKPSGVTSETVDSAFAQKQFDNSRAVEELEMSFTSVRESLSNYRAFYL